MQTNQPNDPLPLQGVWGPQPAMLVDELEPSERAPLVLLATMALGAVVWMLAGLGVLALTGGAK